MTPENYRQQQAEIASKSEQTVLAVAASSTFAGFTLASSLGIFLATANQAATALADAWSASWLGLSPLGLATPENEADRLTEVFATLLERRKIDALPRLGRIAKTEPSNAARQTTRTALIRHQVEARMRWILDPHPCPLCIDLARRTYPLDQLPISHPYCECTVIPVRIVTRKKESA